MSEDKELKARIRCGIERPFGPISKEQHLDDVWVMEMDAAMERATEGNEDYNYHLDWRRKNYY